MRTLAKSYPAFVQDPLAQITWIIISPGGKKIVKNKETKTWVSCIGETVPGKKLVYNSVCHLRVIDNETKRKKATHL